MSNQPPLQGMERNFVFLTVPSVHHSSAISETPSHDSSSASHSRKRSRSPVASVPLSSPTLGALSYVQADLLPSPKRIRSPETTTDFEDCSEDSFEPYVPREVGLGVDFEDESSDLSRSRGADLEMDVDGPVEVRVERVTHPVMPEETPEPAQEGAVEVTYETLGDLVQRFHDHTESIPVHRIQFIEGAQREKMPNTQSRASRTREAINEQSNGRVAEALRVRDAVRNLGPLMGDEVE
ncbi:hypothetical protein Tco_1116512 [Tanacetum coccineum]